jgi:predicted homoserine dehydrogenase-like protein
MNAINEKLEQREKEGRPVKVGLIGVGQMGQEIIAMVGEMVGMEIAAVVDLTADRAAKGYAFSKKQKPMVEPKSPAEAAKAVRDGQWIVSTNARLVTALPGIDAIIDATGSPQMGAEISLEAINHRKHVVMMNVECDITVGPILKQMADNAGVVYSLASGDEPAAILELYRFARALGFTVVAAGKGKNNPLDFYATPDTLEEKAQARGMSARMLCEFVDGSKTMVEMASVSNATGLVPDTRGMHGPHCNIKDLLSVFVPREHGGIMRKPGVVDYAIGDVNPSVFLIVTTDNVRLREGLVQRDMGNGPYYVLLRPYHLCSCEVPLTVARAAFYNESSGHPLHRPVSECFALAKKDLRVGETLDGIGEFCYRGSVDLAETARRENLIPLGLVKGLVMKRDAPRDTPLTWDMVDVKEESVLLQLRRMQDRLHWR